MTKILVIEDETILRGEFMEWLMLEGYVYHRPKQDLTVKQDQTAKQQATELLDELKNGRNRPTLSFSLWTKQP